MRQVIEEVFAASSRVDPATLRVEPRGYAAVVELYRQYAAELSPLCAELAALRATMLAAGYSADFSDAEGELLYLLVRRLQPEVVVEISPCHGYSTNYLLAALTRNGRGSLRSYEIVPAANGRPIEEAIRANLLPTLDQARLEVVVGDARRAPVPAADLLFLDSCHEAYFAAWYLEELVSRAGVVVVHDILVGVGNGGVQPKAASLGVREQYYLLEALAMDSVPLLSVGHFARSADAAARRALPVRYEPEGLDRSVIFPGYVAGEAAGRMHRQMHRVHEALGMALAGDRLGALEAYDAVLREEPSTFLASVAGGILPALGYRYPLEPARYAEIDLDPETITLSGLVAALELANAAMDERLFERALAVGGRSRIDPRVYRGIAADYRAMRSGRPRGGVGVVARRAIDALRARGLA